MIENSMNNARSLPILWIASWCFCLWIEFYLFVSNSGMKDGGSTCKFRNARSAFRNLHMDPVSIIKL